MWLALTQSLNAFRYVICACRLLAYPGYLDPQDHHYYPAHRVLSIIAFLDTVEGRKGLSHTEKYRKKGDEDWDVDLYTTLLVR